MIIETNYSLSLEYCDTFQLMIFLETEPLALILSFSVSLKPNSLIHNAEDLLQTFENHSQIFDVQQKKIAYKILLNCTV